MPLEPTWRCRSSSPHCRRSDRFTHGAVVGSCGIPEDPVTGSAHCALAPYWAARLHKTAFFAFQASRRGGEIRCKWAGDRVELEGSCVLYMEGEAQI